MTREEPSAAYVSQHACVLGAISAQPAPNRMVDENFNHASKAEELGTNECESGFVAVAPIAKKAHAQLTLPLLCFVGFIEGADLQLLPATFGALETDLGLSPARLGQMSLAQSLFMSATSPLWGWFADRYSRKTLLAFSCGAWSVLTLFLAMSTSTKTMLVLRCIHGAALSSLGPIAQSVIADTTEPHLRGAAYGWMYCAVSVGQITASLLGAAFANKEGVLGFRGWRMVFCFTALIAAVAAVIIARLMVDPSREAPAHGCTDVALEANVSMYKSCIRNSMGELKRVRDLMKIRTFNVIALQGVFGSVPWNALGFLTMYLQYCGHGDTASALIVSCMLLGRAGGGVLGGFIGDAMAQRSPNHGRAITAETSVILGIPFTIALVCTAPKASAISLGWISFLLGLMAAWVSSGTNKPILSEVVDPNGRASVVAWIAACEGSSAALFGAPVVGLLAEQVFGYQKMDPHLGFKPTQKHNLSDVAKHERVAGNSSMFVSGDDLRVRNADALSQAMLWGTIPPWIMCAALFSILHITYGPDARRARHSYLHVEVA